MPKCRNFMKNLCDAAYIEYYGRRVSFKSLFESHLKILNIKYYGTLRGYNWSMPSCRNFMRNL